MGNTEKDIDYNYKHNVYADIDDEFITEEKVLERIEIAWTNEMFAPDILPHQTEMLELMIGQLALAEKNMKELDKNDLRFIAHQMDLERTRYVIASYLRCRLQKIETYAKHIVMEEIGREPNDKRLSGDEAIYAQEYLENMGRYFNVFLQYMPSLLRSNADQVVRPNLMTHVFIKANVSVPPIVVGINDEEADISAGSKHIIPYQLVSDLIQKDQARLI